MSDAIPRDGFRTLPIGEIVAAAYRTVFRQPALLAKTALGPYLIAVLVSTCAAVVGPYDLDPLRSGSWLYVIALNLGDLVLYTFFAVAWHRVLLLGPDVGRPSLLPVPGWRHLKFLVYGLVIAAIHWLAVVLLMSEVGTASVSTPEVEHPAFHPPIVFVSGLLSIVLYGLPLYLMVRLSFVFPATAVDERYTPMHSWRHTRQEGLRLLVCVVAAGLPGLILINGFQYGANEVFSGLDPLGGSFTSLSGYVLIVIFLRFLIVALLVTTISIAFKTCTGWISEDEAAGGTSYSST